MSAAAECPSPQVQSRLEERQMEVVIDAPQCTRRDGTGKELSTKC